MSMNIDQPGPVFREKVGSQKTVSLIITDDQGAALDLTNTTQYNSGKWRVWKPDGTDVINGNISYTDRANGVVSYTLQATDCVIANAGIWFGEVELYNTTSQLVDTSDTFTFIIDPSDATVIGSATTYCTSQDVAEFMRINLSEITIPNRAMLDNFITRNEELIDRRTGHTFGRTKQTDYLYYDLPLIYTYGWGTPINLKNRDIKTKAGTLRLDSAQGDRLEMWNGSIDSFTDITDDPRYHVVSERGVIYLRGMIFTIMRKLRIRVKYRYGSSTVPGDIKKACILLTVLDLIRSSFKMDELPFGGSKDKEKSIKDWEDEIERIIRNREEVYVL